MKKNFNYVSTHIIVKCILGIIILSILFSTMNVYIHQDVEKYVATVNGEKISFKILQNMYLMEREKQKKILGKDFIKISHDQNFSKQTYQFVLSQLINNILLEQYAKKTQLKTNELEIKKMILTSSVFQKNQKFDQEKYFNYLASMNLTNHEYFNIIKKKINTEKLINLIANTNFILEDEKQKILKLLSQKRIIRQATLNISDAIQEQKVTNEEAKNYFNQNKKRFYIPEKFKISFVQFTLNNFQTKCNKHEIQEWYLKNIKKYSTTEKRKYSIIQTKNKNHAISILSQVHDQPENFSKIAKEQSTDPISSKNGGNIGWIPIDSIPDEIKQANLNQKNSISQIIPFHNEFLIVKLDDILMRQYKKLDTVYEIIQNEIIHKKSLHLYSQFKNKISDTLKKNPNEFNNILEENNISTQETNWFDKTSMPKKLNIPIIKKILFNNQFIKKNHQKIDSKWIFIILKNNQSFVIKINNFQNKKKPIFKNIKNIIIEKVKFIKAIKETKKKSEKIVLELNKGNQHLFTKSHLYFREPETISRYDERIFTSLVFSLPYPQKEKKIYTVYQDTNKNFIIVLLEKVYSSNFSTKEKNIILEYLNKYNNEIIFNSILKNLHEQSIITYE